jgi:hypothetical protein
MIQVASPSFAAQQRYAGEWVVPVGLGRAHLVTERTHSTVRVACGRTFVGPLQAAALWDGCERCVQQAVLR